MGHREKLKGGHEYDALFSQYVRSIHKWHSGQVKRIKQQFNRRIRREAKISLHKDIADMV